MITKWAFYLLYTNQRKVLWYKVGSVYIRVYRLKDNNIQIIAWFLISTIIKTTIENLKLKKILKMDVSRCLNIFLKNI